jgi:hypothetical protein
MLQRIKFASDILAPGFTAARQAFTLCSQTERDWRLVIAIQFRERHADAIGSRDPSICAFCNSAYTNNFTVNLFDQAGTLLKSVNASNYLYYNTYSSSHGIGAGPVSVLVPAGAATLEIVSQLSVAGLLGSDGSPLGFGRLFISSDGSIVAATPIPSSLPLLATGLVGLGLFGWHRKRRALMTATVCGGARGPFRAA